jgi:heptosyltransferase-3
VSRGRILVIRGGAIGDFILTLPALAALRKQFPQTHLAVLGYPRVAVLAELAGSANEVRSIEARALAGFFARRGELDASLGEWFGGFNIIVSYLYDPDGIFQENVARVSKAQFIAGPHRPDETQSLHATEVFLKPLERLAIFAAESEPRLAISFQPSTLNLLALHPGSGGAGKNWPEACWLELLRRISAETNWRILLVGGEAEAERVQRLALPLPADRLVIALNEALPELARKFTACAAFVGHDSGITHLAAASGLRGLALWGGTKPEIWRPRSEQFALLRDERGLDQLPPDTVFAAISRQMN